MVGYAARELLDVAGLGDDGEEVGEFRGGELDGEDGDAFEEEDVEGAHGEVGTGADDVGMESGGPGVEGGGEGVCEGGIVIDREKERGGGEEDGYEEG